MKALFRSVCVMITIVSAAGLLAGCAKHPASEGSAPPLSRAARGEKRLIVAKVNGTDITLYSLINMTDRISALNSKTSSPEPPEETRKKALDQLIFRELAFQEAVRQGLSVDEQRLDVEMSKFITSVGHEEGYKDFLEKQGLTPVEVRSQVERNLLLQLVAIREVAEKVSISDDEVRKECDRQRDQYLVPEKVSVVDVAFSQNQDDQASMKKANEVLAEINADKDKNPLNLAIDGTFAVRSRDIGKDKEPALYLAARKLRESELSGVLTAPDGIHIIQLSRYTPEKQAPYEEVKGPLKQKLLAFAQVKRFQEWEQELKKDAKIEILEVPAPPEQKKP